MTRPAPDTEPDHRHRPLLHHSTGLNSYFDEGVVPGLIRVRVCLEERIAARHPSRWM